MSTRFDGGTRADLPAGIPEAPSESGVSTAARGCTVAPKAENVARGILDKLLSACTDDLDVGWSPERRNMLRVPPEIFRNHILLDNEGPIPGPRQSARHE